MKDEEKKLADPQEAKAGKKHKFTLQGFFYNNKLVAAFSLLAAIVFWIFTAMTVSPVDTKEISVPIKLDSASVPEQYKLQMFGKLSVEEVKVTVRAKKYILGNLSADDLTATAQTDTVDSAGNKKLSVSVQKKSKNADFTIEKQKISTVEAYFDVQKDITMNIVPDIVGDTVVADGYILGDPVLSSDTVAISGPQTEINKIVQVVARVNVSSPLTSAQTVEPEIIALDAQGAKVSNYLSMNYGNKITLTLPVLKQAVMKTGVSFLNSPAAYVKSPLKVTLTPEQMKIAGAESSLNAMKNVFTVGNIDFTRLTPSNNTFTFDLNTINDVQVLDTQTTVKAVVDMSDMTSRQLDLPEQNIQVLPAPEGFNIQVVSGAISNVRVVGPKGTVKNVKAENLHAILDLSDVSLTEGTHVMNVRIDISGFDNCWAAGQYKIMINVTKK